MLCRRRQLMSLRVQERLHIRLLARSQLVLV